ncbi:hypothetical protein, partial [Tautonia sociabilis]
MNAPPTSPRPALPIRPIAVALLALLALLAPPTTSPARGGLPSEVVRLRVPEETLDGWFPGRAGLVEVEPDRFEELVRAARARPVDGPGLIEPLRIEHQARLDGGLLVGSTTLRFPNGGGGPSWAALWPWSPAIDSVSSASGASVLHRDGDGRAFLRIGPGAGGDGEPREVRLSWALRPRVEAEGRIFDLELIEGPATALVLDLPEGVSPSGPPGYREGPEPTGEPGRSRWRFDGPGGAVVLRLRAGPDPDRPSGPWVGGPSLVELDNLPDGAARWLCSWEIDPGPEGHRPLSVRLGPGVSWEEVSGPDGVVAGVEASPEGDGTRLTIRWRDGLSGPTRLILSGLATIPDPSAWTVCLPEPVDAQWTGGPLLVLPGGSTAVIQARERSGRPLDLAEIPAEARELLSQAAAEAGLPPLAPDDLAPLGGASGPALAFFADRPGPVAELVLAPAGKRCPASVRGTVRLRDGADTLEAEVEYLAPGDGSSLRTLDVSPGWLPDSVRLLDGQGPPRWELETLADGRRRIHVQLPAPPAPDAPGGARRPILLLSASVERERPGELDLPRVRPVGEPVVDERWSILAGPGTVPRPVEAVGLAWLAPPSGTGPSARDARPLLSWRWIEPDGRATVRLESTPSRPSASVSQEATIAGGRLVIDWKIQLDDPGAAPGTLSYRLTPGSSPSAVPSWTAAGADDRQSPPLPVEPAGDADEIRLPAGLVGPVVLLGRLELPWNGEGPLPMIELPRRFETHGRVALRVDPALRCEARGDLSFQEAIEASPPSRSVSPEAIEAGPTRLAASFRYDGPPGRLIVRTEALPAPEVGGAILRADLATWPGGDGVSHNRLTLDLAAPGAEALDVALPPGSSLAAASEGGRPLSPIARGEAIRIPLPPTVEPGPPSAPAPARPRRIALDYETRSPSRPGEIEPGRPRFSLPCLSFSWRVAVPGGRSLSAAGPALMPGDPGPDRAGWLPGLGAGRLAEPRASERAMLARLDELAAANPPSGRPLGRVLSAWDVGRWPMVVDRAALEAQGIGPDSAAPGTASKANATASARRALAPIGLLVVPIDTVLLVTTEAEAPRFSPRGLGSGANREAWVRALREAVAWGSDRSDRFLTVERWRARGAARNAEDVADTPRSEARTVLRFVAPGWPTRGTALRTIDPWPWSALGGGLGLVLILGGAIRLPGRGWATLRIVLLLALAAMALALAHGGGPRAAASATTAFYATLIALAAASIRRSPPAHRGEAVPGSTVIRSHGTGSRAGVGAAVVLAAIGPRGTAEAIPIQRPEAPILAFLIEPAEGESEPDPSIWLRQEDLDRLVAAAEEQQEGADRPASPPEWPRIGAVSAEHVLRPDSEGNGGWLLESRLWLAFEEGGPASWSLPIGRPTSLEAVLDGRPRPVLVGPEGNRATVAIDGPAGPHELVIRQRVRPEADSGGDRLVVPINPVARARLDVAGLPGSGPPVVLAARGATSPGADGHTRAELGPVNRIEVGWDRGEPLGEPASAPRIEGLLLWEALPSADRLAARLTVRSPSPVRELWFAIEPGVAVRSVRAAGALVEGSRVVAGDGDRWAARIDPPLPDGGTLELELWRPQEGPLPSAGDEPSPRRPPLLEPLGVSRFEGRIALLRPETWGGRLGSQPGAPAISEQEFEQDWGPLPSGAALAPSGASRFEGAPRPAVPMGPTPARRQVETSLQLDLDAGRWDWRLSAELADLDGRTIREAELVLPADLELIDVDAPGLTAWDRPSPDRLRLRFDGPASSSRGIAVVGWLPQPCGPMNPGPLVEERPLPWPDWPGAAQRPGTLLLSSPNTALISYVGPDGTPVPIDRLASSNNRRPYRRIVVDRPGGLLRVESFPAVTVELWSQLSLGRRSARWEALVRFSVTGGPADRIELDVPDAWAEGAEYELEGFGPIATRDLGDRIEITPERPIWGTVDLRIRSVRPRQPDRPLAFPDLVPWGRGTFPSHTIAVVAPDRRPPLLDYSGLEPATEATRDQFDAAFPVPAGTSRTVFSVLQGGWSLVVRPPAGTPPAEDDAGQAIVALGEASCAIGPDGSLIGHAAFELRPGLAPFLTLLAPPGAVSPAAAVDGRLVQPRLDGEGRWLIPLGDGPSRRVELSWIDPARRGTGAPSPGRRVAIPQPAQDGVPMLVAVSCAEGDTLDASGGSILLAPASAPLVDRLEHAAARIRERLSSPDPDPDAGASASASIEPDPLTAELSRFLTLQRQAERSAYWAALMRPDSAEVVRQRGPLRRILTVRESLDAALDAAGRPGLLSPTAAPPPPAPGPP